jgi:hypothetical protein
MKGNLAPRYIGPFTHTPEVWTHGIQTGVTAIFGRSS